MPGPRWLSAADVDGCASMTEMIEAMRQAFEALAGGRAIAPVRTVLQLPTGTTLTMPAALPESGSTAVKLVSVYPRNPERGLPSVMGIVAVLDASSGEPVALMEGSYLTGLRTGAASGLATQLLSRPDARVLGMIGTGYQARFQVEAVLAVRPITEVRVYGRSESRREQFVAELASAGFASGVRMLAVSTPTAAIAEADVVCTATTSTTSVFDANDISPGTHLNGVGSYTLQMSEVPPDLVRRARVFVDSREAAKAEAGDLLAAVQEGSLDWDNLPEIGAVLLGTHGGREGPDEVTFFKSVGLAVQDVAAAGLIAQKARELGIGQELEL